MSLNDLRLTPSILTELYQRTLVLPGGEVVALPEPEEMQSGEGWKYLGENRKNILVVVDHQNVAFLPDEELVFLTNMLTACRLSMADIALVNFHTHPETHYKDWLAGFASHVILLFGVSPVSFGLPINFPHFQLQQHGGARFLFAPTVPEIAGNNLLKSKLWVSLRQLFNI